MKKFKSAIAWVLCALMLCACTGPVKNPDSQPTGTTATTYPAEQTYSVTVLDSNGDPVTGGVVVNFMKDGEAVAMQMVNGQGVAEKVLPTGHYTVELGFLDTSVSHHYDTSDLTLTPDKTALSVVLSQGLSENSLSLNAYSQTKDRYEDYQAHFISPGSTYVPLDTQDRTYVLFAPTQSGVYEFKVLDDGVVMGYYGSEHFVLSYNAAENGDEHQFIINVSNGMIGTDGAGTAVMVIGLDSNGATECTVSITRISDAELTIDDMPWDIYENKQTPAQFTLPDHVTIRDFDLKASTNSYQLVKGDDGLYHLGSKDGFVVYARLGSPSAYMDSIESILENAGMYYFFFDEDGDFIRKEGYSQAMQEYIACMDQVSGLYPLTDDILYMFQSHGSYVGWWDPKSPGYLFEDANGDPLPGINNELGWLFLCCYGETDPDDPCNAGHAEVIDAAKAPTCTREGLTEGTHCSVCGKVLTEQKKVPATGHSYGGWVEIQAPSADTEGLAERTCAVCGHKEQKTLGMVDAPDPEPKPEQVVGKPNNPDLPLELYGAGALSFDAQVKSGEYVIYHIYRLSGVYLTIEDEFAYVVYDGKTYWPEDGKISLLLINDSTYTPIEVHIGNYGFEDRTIHVDCLYPLGDMMNPERLKLGSFTTVLEPGNDQGYYYSFTADSSGVLTIVLDQVPAGVSCSVILYNLDSYEYVVMESNTASVKVKAGQNVQINISLATDDFQFPGGTVVATAVFE